MNRRFNRNAVFAGILFGIAMGLYFSWLWGLKVGLVSGIVTGILFGFFTSIFTTRTSKRMMSHTGLFEGEPVIFQGPANHFKNAEGRGGWLTLTPTCLAFRSHKINVQNAPLNILLRDIKSAEGSLTFGLIPNGLKVKMKNGDIERFVVNNRKEWVKNITENKGL